ncbi:ABC transporter ATP-binding protein [Halobacteriales archaeon QS_8_69_26]|nr:MAG: ABC transporter ATP-binding protein [Halobacteriales archaeon QS_8_69_26]
MSDPAVEVENVAKTYGETTALSGVSLSVGEGEVFGLLGPNGAGKTTLVRAITGTTAVDEGAVRVFGSSPGRIDRSRLGVLPQSFSPPGRLTARELLSYYGGLYDRSRPVDAVLDAVGLADAADTRYANLSGGQQRRVCLGTALVNDPDLLVLDEPTTGIDPAGRREVRRRIADLAAGGATVLLTTHDIDETERLVDRVALLSAGEVAATGAPSALVREHGGAPRLVVETAAGPEAVGDAYEVEATDRGLAFPGVDPSGIGGVVEALDDRGVEYAALRWSRPGLEDVYLRLTGTGTTRVTAGSLNEVAGDGGGGSQ